MSKILDYFNIPMFGSSEEDKMVLDVLSSSDGKVLSESKMKTATKNELQNSLRHTKAIANRLGRIGLAFYIAWANKHDATPEELVKIAKETSRLYDPKYLNGKN